MSHDTRINSSSETRRILFLLLWCFLIIMNTVSFVKNNCVANSELDHLTSTVHAFHLSIITVSYLGTFRSLLHGTFNASQLADNTQNEC